MKDAKRKMKICFIAGARPNFMKVAALIEACKKYPDVEYTLVHTGQHYDEQMSKVFFDEFGLKTPDIDLGVGSDEPLLQREAIEKKLGEVFKKERPDLVVVVGDVTSTLAGARAAKRVGIPVAHVEAGLRSGNYEMFEEFNRIQTDHISDYLFASEAAGMKNLSQEHVAGRVALAGNVMIDTLRKFLPKAQDLESKVLSGNLKLQKNQYALLTLHRAENVDANLESKLRVLERAAKIVPIVFPVHPRTRERIGQSRAREMFSNSIECISPQGYIEFLALMKNAKVVLTDSGGIQEETTALGVPCLTLRNETERPVTVEVGTNEIVGLSEKKIARCMKKIVEGKWKKGKIPAGFDGRAAERIINFLRNDFLRKQTLLVTHATSIYNAKN